MTKTVKANFRLLLLLGFIHTGIFYAQGQNTTVKERSLTSATLNKKVKLLVSVPEGYKTSKKYYPILYVTNASTKSVEETAAEAQSMHQEKGTPEMIIIGIEPGADDIDGFATNLKAKDFQSFMERELFPFIEKKYRSNKQRVLYDKSLRGSFALYAFLSTPALFNGYIAASKQWYDANNDYFSNLANKALQNPARFKGRKIFLATMNGAYNNNNIPEVDRQMLGFSESLSTKSGNKISSKYQACDDWSGVPSSCFKDGLQFVCPSEAQTNPGALKMTQNATGKWVILDKQNKEIYEVFPFDNGPDTPSEGLIRIVKNGKIGYADANTYAVVIPPQFDCAYPFEKGKAKVSKNCKTIKEGEHSIWESDAWQFVDKKGRF